MFRFNKALIGAFIAGVLGLLFATVGFWRALMIIFLIVLGYLVGTYLDTRKKEED